MFTRGKEVVYSARYTAAYVVAINLQAEVWDMVMMGGKQPRSCTPRNMKL